MSRQPPIGWRQRGPGVRGWQGLAAEAIAAFVEEESWQLNESQTGIKELDGWVCNTM